jgi:hypothetical protein
MYVITIIILRMITVFNFKTQLVYGRRPDTCVLLCSVFWGLGGGNCKHPRAARIMRFKTKQKHVLPVCALSFHVRAHKPSRLCGNKHDKQQWWCNPILLAVHACTFIFGVLTFGLRPLRMSGFAVAAWRCVVLFVPCALIL